SATASAKLAKSTVNQSQRLIWNEKPVLPAPVTRSRMNNTVVSMVTTSTTNMTGFFIITRGSSLRKAAAIAGMRILGSVRVAEVDRLRILPPDRVVAVMM